MRRLASVFNRFDGELLGLLLLSLGLLLLASVLVSPGSGVLVSPAGGLANSTGHWLVGSLSWAAMLTPWPLIGVGGLLLLSRPVGRVLRWSVGGAVVVLALLGLHDLWAPGAAGTLAATAMTPLFAYLGYGAALPALLLLSLGLELMLALAPLTLLRALARAALRALRWLGGRALQLTDQARVGQTVARERAGVRRRLAAQQADLETLLGLLPGDETVQTLAARAEGQRRALGSLGGPELARSAAETEEREAEVRRLTGEAAAVQAARLAARPELGSVLAMAARQLRAGRHPLSQELPLNAVSAALDEVRLALCGDLQRLQARAEELDRAQSRDLQALQKPSPALLASVQRREGERAAAWEALGEAYRDWLVFERAYPGWPELAARYDAAPAGLAGALAGALQARGRDLLPERGEWAAHLEQAPAGAGPVGAPAPAPVANPGPSVPGPVSGPVSGPVPVTPPARPPAAPIRAGGTLRLPAPGSAPGMVAPSRERRPVVAGSARPLPAPAVTEPSPAPAPAPMPATPTPVPDPTPPAPVPATATVTQLRIVPTPVGLTLSPGRSALASPESTAVHSAPVHRAAVHSVPVPSAAAGSAAPAASGAAPRPEPAPAREDSAPLPGQLKVSEDLPWEEPQSPAPAPAPRVRAQGAIDPVLPGFNLLSPVPEADAALALLDEEAQGRAALINETLSQFGLSARVVDFARGPTVTRYEIEPAPGEKISRIAGLANDLARALAVGGVRIEAPVPGKSVIGLEVPNLQREPVTFHQAVASPSFQASRAKLPIVLGKSIDGQMMVGDLAKMPHLLIAGSTGSGKSVCVNTLITSLLYRYLPSELRFLMIDPKMVELTPYDGIPHLVRGVVTNPSDAAGVLLGAVAHMERRYKMMSQVGAKNLEQYNAKMRVIHEPELPQLVVIIDELADLMITSPKEVESAIMRLAQMARATGMHLVLATQRPSVDILTSLIKVNVPARVAFAVSSSHDSRTILDSMGAERLTGQGDMLFYQPGLVKPMRLQGPFIGEEESVRITTFLQRQVFDDVFVETYGSDFDGPVMGEGSGVSAQMDFSDPLLKQAALVCLEEGQGSVSRLQRRLSVGHARAGKLMDMLEAMSIVSKHQGSKPREVLITLDQLPEFFG